MWAHCKNVRNAKYITMGKEVKWNLVFCLLCSPYKKEGLGPCPSRWKLKKQSLRYLCLVPGQISPICLPLHPRASESTWTWCCLLQFPQPLTPCLGASSVEWGFTSHNLYSRLTLPFLSWLLPYLSLSGKIKAFFSPEGRKSWTLDFPSYLSPAVCPSGPVGSTDQNLLVDSPGDMKDSKVVSTLSPLPQVSPCN